MRTSIKNILMSSVLLSSTLVPTTGVSAQQQCHTFASDLSWSGGGAYPQIKRNNGELFLISDVAGAWKASDSEVKWRQINNGLGNLSLSSLTFSPSHPNTGYATTYRGIYKTTDNGEQWQLLDYVGTDKNFHRWDSYRSLSINSINPNHIFFGTRTGQIFYANGSDVVEVGKLNAEESVKSVLLHSDNKMLSVGSLSERHLYFLNEEGDWQLARQEARSAMDMTKVTHQGKENIIAVGEQSVSFSVNGGVEWHEKSLASKLESDAILHRISVAQNESGETRILVAWVDGWTSGILKSDDFGDSWSVVSLSDLEFSNENPTRLWKKSAVNRILSVYVEPHQLDTMYVTTYWGIWRTTDGGLTWSENFKKGASNRAGSGITYASNGDLLTASMDVGLIRYGANSTYSEYPYIEDVAEFESSSTVTRFAALMPQNSEYDIHREVAGHVWNVISIGEHLVATNSPWESSANQILVSADNGGSWTVVTEGLPERYASYNTVWHKGFARALEVDPHDSDTDPAKRRIYLGIDGHGLYVSENGGYSWSPSVGQPNNLRLYNAMSIDPSQPNVIYWGAPQSGMYVSKDGGASWQVDGLRWKAIFDAAVSKDGTAYAGVQGETGPELYVKRGSNADWQLLKLFDGDEGTVEAISIDPKNNDIIAVSVNRWSHANTGKVYLSYDGGASWQQANIEVGVGAADMAFSPCNNELALIEYAGGVKLYPLDLPVLNLGIGTMDFSSRKDWWLWKEIPEENALIISLHRKAINYNFTLDRRSDLEFSLEAKNFGGSRVLPANYRYFNVEVYIDGVLRSTEKVKASDSEWHPLNLNIQGLAEGEHTLTLNWTNNQSSSTTDTNFGFRHVSFIQHLITSH